MPLEVRTPPQRHNLPGHVPDPTFLEGNQEEVRQRTWRQRQQESFTGAVVGTGACGIRRMHLMLLSTV